VHQGILNSEGTFTIINPVPPAIGLRATGINDAGQIVGALEFPPPPRIPEPSSIELLQSA